MPVTVGGKFRLAAARGDVAMMAAIQQFCAKNFDADISVNGFTALHIASCQGHSEAVLWLLENGADVHSEKSDGWMYNAIHYAASQGHLECVKVLCDFGANWAKQTFDGTYHEKLLMFEMFENSRSRK